MEAKASMVVTNNGSRPWHFAVSQPNDRRVRVLPARGVVYPGFKITLSVVFLGGQQDVISTFFSLTAKEPTGPITELKIPVSVKIE
jgi:hypothetical protein